ncbi:toll/interleukin-1 receptor domain-containing protein [Maritalea sp.]|uniref:toll/interleukin-1 receptor domain-containing protein n=1 Tax=Maritalea sp. TaxID=2003361 RepID=UPI003EF28516
MTTLFFSYSHADEDLRDMLEKHLAALKHQGLIEFWHDRRISAGTELDGAIDKNLNDAGVILLLVSSDFIASRYCYDVEMKRAMERHQKNDAVVIPVILRPCDWHDTPFGMLLGVPRDGKAITSWTNLDEAFLDVVQAIKKVVRKQTSTTKELPDTTTEHTSISSVESAVHRPRSANLRTRKTFSEADKDQFLDESFSYMALYFENSLQELQERSEDLTTRFKKIDGNSFTAVIYRNGDAKSRCKIKLGGMFNGISYSASDRADDNSYNENMSIDCDDQHMYLKPIGMAMHGGQKDTPLTAEGASEYYWSMLIQAVQ